MEAETFQQSDRAKVIGFDRGEEPVDSVIQLQMFKHGSHRRTREAAAPMLSGKNIGDPGVALSGHGGLHIAQQRPCWRTQYPVQPALPAVGRLARFEPLVDAAEMLDRRRRRIVEVAVDLRVREKLEHRLCMGRDQRLEHQRSGVDGLHATDEGSRGRERGIYSPATATMLDVAARSRIARSGRYSGDSQNVFRAAMFSNSRITVRFGDRVPSSTSAAPPRTT